MRIYNKRKFFIGIGEFILSIVAFVTMFITRTIDIKFIVVNVIVFTLREVFQNQIRQKIL